MAFSFESLLLKLAMVNLRCGYITFFLLLSDYQPTMCSYGKAPWKQGQYAAARQVQIICVKGYEPVL